ncbi:adhesion G protein-coupled receptor L3-like isoform X2 [Dreissena polymorpha]|uniref:adhesion G protein-coupled receptor L3-like isoform X2 n=1 Tax=Dreissena polymorpha TaxID=45954 RepID=UPI002263D109|nr:adhesion G protein-coupled receptor L3-like isoform X2 [Dreissena polymorpha]
MVWTIICTVFMWIIIDQRGKAASQDCGANHHLHGETGSFSSPFYPNNYRDDETCTYTIEVATGHKVCVIINNFAVEPGYDYLDLHDGLITSLVLKRFNKTFSNGNEHVLSSGNMMTAFWHTDISVVNSGFYAQFKAVLNCSECSSADCKQWSGLSDLPVNQMIAYPNHTTCIGDTVLMTCDAGYHVVNDPRTHTEMAVCTSNGIWSPHTYSRCVPIDCKQWSGLTDLPVNQKIAYLNNSTFVGATVLMTCDAGYHVFNDSSTHTEMAVCTSNGTWNPHTYSHCVPIDCGLPPALANGMMKLMNNKTHFQSQADVICKHGFFLNGSFSTFNCTDDGHWSLDDSHRCLPVDCGLPPPLANGKVKLLNNLTTFPSQAEVTCNRGYFLNSSFNILNCTEKGSWSQDSYSCLLVDCSEWYSSSPKHQTIIYKNATSFGSKAIMTCNPGYHVVNKTNILSESAVCTENGTWSLPSYAVCVQSECPVLEPYDKLTIEMVPNTTKAIVNTTAMFSCLPGLMLVGYATIKCTINGQWNGPVPKCVALEKAVRNCPVNIDTKDRTWQETQPGTIVVENCPNDYSGAVSRQCSKEGLWLNPFYNCVSKRVAELMSAVESIKESPSAAKITHSLDQLVNITKPANGSSYIGELYAITSMLDTIASVSDNIEVTDEQANSFFSTTSNLLDTDNAESWQSGANRYESDGSTDGSSTAKPGAIKVLNVVDKYTDILKNSLGNNSESSKTIQSENMASYPISVVHVSMVNTTSDELQFPDKPLGITSSVILPKASVLGSKTIAAVVYRNLSGIISSKLKNVSDSTINSEVVTVTLDNWENTTNFVVDITMEYARNLQSAPICSFWNASIFSWDTTGCRVMSSNHSSATCRCTHLTNFAILMSPFIQSKANSKDLDIISIVGCSISLAGLTLTISFHIVLWKYVSKRRVAVLLNLSVALIISYVMFIGGIDRTESKIVCTTLASLLHYIYLVVFSLMLVEGIDVAVSILIVFQTRSKLKWMLSAAWVVPAVVVGISLGVTKTKGYGNEISCWLTIKGGVIWAFVGPALLIVLVNFIILVIVIRATLRSYTMAKKSTVERSKSAVWCLLVLLPLMGLTWVLGVFYLDESMVWVQYAFAVCNSLQGLVIFIFHCAFNKTLWKAYKKKKQRSSYASRTYLKSRSTSVRSVITENSEVSLNVYDTIEIPSAGESANIRYEDLSIKQPMQTAANADKEEQGDGISKHSEDNANDDKLRRNGDQETVNTYNNDVGLEILTDKYLYSTVL